MSNIHEQLLARRRQIDALNKRIDALAGSKSTKASTERREVTREQVLDLLRELATGTDEDAAWARSVLAKIGEPAQTPARADALRARMGLPSRGPRIREEGTTMIFGVLTPAQAREHRAARRTR